MGLRDCDLELPAGTVTALVGPDGAGKTTLLQLAVGLGRPSAGDVRVLGLSPRDDAAVMEVVADTGMTVVLSSHIVADLQRVCDHLVILAAGRTQLVGPIDEILHGHRLLTGPRTDAAAVAALHDVIRESHTERQTTLLVRANGHVYDACWELHELDLEEIVLAYLGQGAAARAEAGERVPA